MISCGEDKYSYPGISREARPTVTRNWRSLGFWTILRAYEHLDWVAGKESAYNAGNTGDMGLIPGSGRSPRGQNGNPVQYFWLKNPMDRGAWRASPWGHKEWDTTEWPSTHASLTRLEWSLNPVFEECLIPLNASFWQGVLWVPKSTGCRDLMKTDQLTLPCFCLLVNPHVSPGTDSVCDLFSFWFSLFAQPTRRPLVLSWV